MIIDDRSAFDRADSVHQRPEVRGGHLGYGLRLQFFNSFEAAAPVWKVFERRAISSPFQSYSWLDNWYRHRGQQIGVLPLLVFGYDRFDRLRVVVPLGVSPRKKMWRLGWLGDELSGLNGPIVDPAYVAALDEAALSAMFAEAIQQLGTIDIIDLVHQPRRLGRHLNPFARTAAPMAHAMTRHLKLPGSWEQFGSTETRRRRAEESHTRRQLLRERGEISVRLNAEPDESARIIDTVLSSAGPASGAEGHDPILAQPGAVDFFKALSSDKNACPLAVSVVEAGGALLAATFGYTCGESFVHSLAFVENTPQGAAAEDLLLEETIRSCIVRGIEQITFLGDSAAGAVAETGIEAEPLVRTLVGVSAKGKLAIAGNRLRNRWQRGERGSDIYHCRRREFPAPDERKSPPAATR